MYRASPRRCFFLIFLILVFGLLEAGPVWGAQNPDPLTEKVDKVFSFWDKPESPGCALGIIQDGEFVYRRGFGMANLEHGIPLSSQSIFRIGSTSKQFTAMCILLLEEEGKLSLEDSLKKYFPEFPDYAESITIRHLIHHTSGIRDYLTLMALAGARGDDYYTDAEVVDLLSRQKELNFDPGEEMLYSNSGYFLLSQIVRRITGESMRIYADERIFKPLGMTNTHFHDDHNQIVKNRASGYSRQRGGGYRISMTTLDMIGDGGVFTCVDDLLRWDANFYDNRLGKKRPELIAKMQTPGILNNGERLDYACGLGVTEYKGLRLVSHGGAFVGFRADMLRFPEQKFSVIVLANLSAVNPSQLARRVADIYLAEAFQPGDKLETEKAAGTKPAEKKEEQRFVLPEDQLRSFVGDYHSSELDVVYRIFFEEGKLLLGHENPHRPFPGGPLVPAEENTFHLGRLVLKFEKAEENAAASFIINAGRVQNIRFVKK